MMAVVMLVTTLEQFEYFQSFPCPLFSPERLENKKRAGKRGLAMVSDHEAGAGPPDRLDQCSCSTSWL